MPRKPRLDAPGFVHHVIVRGIERRDIFVDNADRYEFLKRLSVVAGAENNQLFAFALMPNHVHLLMRTLALPLSSCMRRLLTGYAIYFNRRHNRCGHLFQNRYKSFIVDEHAYLLELVRYIHLNPVRAGLCADVGSLAKRPFFGHAVLMGRAAYPWFEPAHTLALFGSSYTGAREKLVKFMVDGLAKGRRDDLVGGGLKRSLAALDPSERAQIVAHDERILGCGDFVEAVLAALEQNEVPALKEISLGEFIEQTAAHFGLTSQELCSGTRRRAVVRARAAAIWLGMKRHGFSANELSEALSISRTRIYEILNLGRGEKESDGVVV
ncbi:MAG: transposase [Candidatus Aquicultor sp.]|nr:transposase [Candidatus Aquicultor sp.]